MTIVERFRAERAPILGHVLFDYNLGEYESACEPEFTLTGMADLQVAFERAVTQEDLFTS